MSMEFENEGNFEIKFVAKGILEGGNSTTQFYTKIGDKDLDEVPFKTKKLNVYLGFISFMAMHCGKFRY